MFPLGVPVRAGSAGSGRAVGVLGDGHGVRDVVVSVRLAGGVAARSTELTAVSAPPVACGSVARVASSTGRYLMGTDLVRTSNP